MVLSVSAPETARGTAVCAHAQVALETPLASVGPAVPAMPALAHAQSSPESHAPLTL